MPRNSETDRPSAEEISFLDGVWASTPILPVGEIPILGLSPEGKPILEEPEDADEIVDVYALHGIHEILVDVRRTRRDTKGPVIGCEVCCATSTETAHSIVREFFECWRRATKIDHDLFTTQATEKLKANAPQFMPLVKELVWQGQGHDGRPLLVSAITRTLFGLTPEESNDADTFRDKLRENLIEQQYVYGMAKTSDLEGLEVGWKLRFGSRLADQNYLQILSSFLVPTASAVYAGERLKWGDGQKTGALRQVVKARKRAGEELAREFIDWQVDAVAEIVVGNERFRPARYISMDMLDSDIIARNAKATTPQSTQSMHMFPYGLAHLGNPYHHIQGDIRDGIPVPNETLTFIISVDGWRPIEHRLVRRPGELKREVAEAVVVLHGLYKKLVSGGQLVVYPWAEDKTSWRERRALDRVKLELARLVSHGVETKTFHPDTVNAWMTPGDRDLAARTTSALRRWRKRPFEALIVTRLHGPMVDRPARNAKAAEKRATVSQAQSPDLLDPTP